jgi:hypothetical protein
MQQIHSLVWGVVALLVAAPAGAQIRADLVASGLTQPVAFVQDPAHADIQVTHAALPASAVAHDVILRMLRSTRNAAR